ncbi:MULTISPECIES: NUDIX domain-containing protein [Bacillus]|uniref:NUDIX domain-containing protein n=1 Tax=Bacillus TaxID=1386 RepID=UPI000BB72F5D|nr:MULTISPECIES: NUDIX hydrolase [Bacillus]
MTKRGSIWLAVAGIVESEDGKVLVVKKQYGGLKGKWSFPAGFLEAGETLDQAIIREIKEETGIECTIESIVGVRSGVIKNEISDNMIMFSCHPIHTTIVHDENELIEAVFLTHEELKNDPNTSLLVHYYIDNKLKNSLKQVQTEGPGEIFGYTSYNVFF